LWNLDSDQIREQFVSLSRCKRDSAMLKQLLDYFALPENFKKAAQEDEQSRGSPENKRASPVCF